MDFWFVIVWITLALMKAEGKDRDGKEKGRGMEGVVSFSWIRIQQKQTSKKISSIIFMLFPLTFLCI